VQFWLRPTRMVTAVTYMECVMKLVFAYFQASILHTATFIIPSGSFTGGH